MGKKVKLGDRCRDEVSGWEGVLTARYEYLNGCIRYEVSGADEHGKPEGFVFDEQQVVRVEAGRVERDVGSATGGPRDNRPVSR